MKIGIITFHRAINYGAVLQAYSLMHFLVSQGHQVKLIDYYPTSDEFDYKIFRPLSSVKNILYDILVLPYSNKIKKKKYRFAEFLQKETLLTHRFYSYDELCEGKLDFDAIITGSDQVFNPVNVEAVKTYYLGFADEKICMIAYAPSFGINSFPDELVNKLRPYLSRFQYLSCREPNGSEFISKVCGLKCPTVIDPVFLTSQENWNNLAQTSTAEEGYIFVYDLNGREKLISLANRLKKETGLPIKCISTKKYFVKKYNVDELILDAGPIELLRYISKANYVLTDSFHGMSFSLIYRKKFFVCNAHRKASDRLSSLLSYLNLQNKLISLDDAENVNLKFISESIDYDELLNRRIKFSIEYLNDSLK